MERTMRGFTLLELTLTLIIMGVLAAVALPKLSDSKEAALAAAINSNHGAVLVTHSRLIADGFAQTPSAPYPALRRLTAESRGYSLRLAIDSSGVCVGGSYKLATYAGSNQMTATVSPSDPVRSVALDIAEDSDHCQLP